MSIWEPFTERARRSVVRAQEEAQRFGAYFIGTEHVLLGIICEDESIGSRVLDTLGANLAKVRAEVETIVRRGAEIVHHEMAFTPGAKRMIELGFEEARLLNHHYIGTEHLLLGLIREREGVGAKVLENLEIRIDNVRRGIASLLETSGPEPIGVAHQVSQSMTSIERSRSGPHIDRMTIAAAHAVLSAKEAAMRAGRRVYDAEHLMYGIAHVEGSVASRVLAERGASVDGIGRHLGKPTGDLELSEAEIEASDAVMKVFRRATVRLASASRLLIDPELLLSELIDDEENNALKILRALGVAVDDARVKLKEHIDGRNA